MVLFNKEMWNILHQHNSNVNEAYSIFFWLPPSYPYHWYQYCDIVTTVKKYFFDDILLFSGYPLDHQSCKFLVSSNKDDAFIWPFVTDLNIFYASMRYDISQFQVGSYIHDNTQINFSGKYEQNIYSLFLFLLPDMSTMLRTNGHSSTSWSVSTLVPTIRSSTGPTSPSHRPASRYLFCFSLVFQVPARSEIFSSTFGEIFWNCSRNWVGHGIDRVEYSQIGRCPL